MVMAKPEVSIVLGFDFGMKRIGVAVGQGITLSATPLPILKAKDGIPDWGKISDLIKQWHVTAFVVGIPYNMDGSEQNTTFCARKFCNRLQEKFRLPVYEIDERLTTVEAKSRFYEQAKQTNIEMDSYAAKLILESWFRNSKNK